ncbi:hypothetical protein BV25DRAFT_928938 [Artomyces pyxidatus]|uniref:Uncharacterized protein n=1 Tax=Artomyces pyxidatus TaxID=48021 RepID=A0ACB8SY27_9AGAM|nr:hypothetical protein BV25DRAFT_928938 [Artomyces pyxidatus]
MSKRARVAARTSDFYGILFLSYRSEFCSLLFSILCSLKVICLTLFRYDFWPPFLCLYSIDPLISTLDKLVVFINVVPQLCI